MWDQSYTADDRETVIADWKRATRSGEHYPSIETELCHHVPELGALYERWLTLFGEDQAAHTAAQPKFDAIDPATYPADFTPQSWRQETRDARSAYDSMLAELGK